MKTLIKLMGTTNEILQVFADELGVEIDVTSGNVTVTWEQLEELLKMLEEAKRVTRVLGIYPVKSEEF